MFRPRFEPNFATDASSAVTESELLEEDDLSFFLFFFFFFFFFLFFFALLCFLLRFLSEEDELELDELLSSPGGPPRVLVRPGVEDDDFPKLGSGTIASLGRCIPDGSECESYAYAPELADGISPTEDDIVIGTAKI